MWKPVLLLHPTHHVYMKRKCNAKSKRFISEISTLKIELYVNDRFCIETYIIDSVVYKTTDFIVLEQVFRDTKCIV